MTQVWPPQNEDQRDVFVLGAGFSKAISELMPLTDELGNKCRELLIGDGIEQTRMPKFRDGSFETWLSKLAEEQPYLDVASNLDNQALFQRFSTKIGEILSQVGRKVLDSPMPTWLANFVLLAHLRRWTLLSFNYDVLIECTVASDVLYDWRALPAQRPGSPVSWSLIIDDVPPIPSGYARLAPSPAKTLSLLKLHGSLNWFWSPGDATGASFCHLSMLGKFGSPRDPLEIQQERSTSAAGKVPFIVPPSAVKSSYYLNPITRHVWQTAWARLKKANRVVVGGYSFPLTDLSFGALFCDAFHSESTSLQIVDPDAVGVLGRLRTSLQLPDLKVDQSVKSFKDFVYCEIFREAKGAATHLRTYESGNEKLAVAWGGHAAAAVTGVSRDSAGRLCLTISDTYTLESVMNCAGIPPSPEPQRAAEMTALLKVGDVIEIRVANDRREFVVGVAADARDVGEQAEPWIILIASGTAPDVESDKYD